MHCHLLLSKQNIGIEHMNSIFSLSVRYGEKKKNLLVFKKLPTLKFIFFYLEECQKIIEKGKGQSVFSLLDFLSNKILMFSKQEKYDRSSKLFLYLHQKIFQYLWTWAKKTHPKKSKNWIRQKYFYNLKKPKGPTWVFGQKVGTNFFYLPFFSEIKHQDLFCIDFFYFPWIFQKNIF